MLIVFALCAALVWVGALLLGLPTDQLMSLLLSWQVLIGLVVLIALYARLSTLLRPPGPSRVDRSHPSASTSSLDV